MTLPRAAAVLAVLALAAPAPAGVVINEIMYHAPDDLDDLQFVELHNTSAGRSTCPAGSSRPQYEFPAGTKIEANGYLVVCKDLKEFKKHSASMPPASSGAGCSTTGEPIDLIDAAGKRIDGVKYAARDPWPVRAGRLLVVAGAHLPDGRRASSPENWAPSPLARPARPSRAARPGKRNASLRRDAPAGRSAEGHRHPAPRRTRIRK